MVVKYEQCTTFAVDFQVKKLKRAKPFLLKYFQVLEEPWKSKKLPCQKPGFLNVHELRVQYSKVTFNVNTESKRCLLIFAKLWYLVLYKLNSSSFRNSCNSNTRFQDVYASLYFPNVGGKRKIVLPFFIVFLFQLSDVYLSY